MECVNAQHKGASWHFQNALKLAPKVMEISPEQYERIAPYLPVQRGNVSIPNLQVLNAILYVAEHGCKWRGLPPRAIASYPRRTLSR